LNNIEQIGFETFMIRSMDCNIVTLLCFTEDSTY